MLNISKWGVNLNTFKVSFTHAHLCDYVALPRQTKNQFLIIVSIFLVDLKPTFIDLIVLRDFEECNFKLELFYFSSQILNKQYCNNLRGTDIWVWNCNQDIISKISKSRSQVLRLELGRWRVIWDENVKNFWSCLIS